MNGGTQSSALDVVHAAIVAPIRSAAKATSTIRSVRSKSLKNTDCRTMNGLRGLPFAPYWSL